jgi:AraC-like DNA-binding protein
LVADGQPGSRLIYPAKADLGAADGSNALALAQPVQDGGATERLGLELLEDTTCILVQRIINAILEVARRSDEPLSQNLSVYLSSRLKHNYVYMSNLFSEKLGTTIEKFYIFHKIERVKELLILDECNLTEIAFTLHYSSPAHLSNQFKKVTGLTPSRFRKESERKKPFQQNS